MPKFHVVCEEQYFPRRVVFEVEATSAQAAEAKVWDSRFPHAEFEEVGEYREPEIVVKRARPASKVET